MRAHFHPEDPGLLFYLSYPHSLPYQIYGFPNNHPCVEKKFITRFLNFIALFSILGVFLQTFNNRFTKQRGDE